MAAGAIANLNSLASFVSPMLAAAGHAHDAAGHNTQVFCVYPGPIDTKMGEVLTLEKASPADAARGLSRVSSRAMRKSFPTR
jgi:NAD(P)-dependent dehydrogenase (short-subunit alcohol dehydrogenase family)